MNQTTPIISLVSFVFVFGSMGFLSNAAFGQTDSETNAEAVEISHASMPTRLSVEDTGVMLEEKVDEYFKTEYGKKLKNRERLGEIYIGWAQSQVIVKPENPNWAKFRVLAFQDAMTKAEDEYIIAKGIELKAEKIRDIYVDAGSEAPKFDNNDLNNEKKTVRIIDKLLSVTEGKLDKELEELDIDPEEFSSLPRTQRHKKLRRALHMTMVKRSIGSLAGVMPIQSFEAQNKAGDHTIGVIVVASDRLRQFADDIQTKRGEFENKKTPFELFNEITADKLALVDEFGVRKVVDEQGYEVLISYGQWANSSQSSDSAVRQEFRNAAKDQARNRADFAIALYLKGSSVFTDKSTVGEQLEQSLVVHEDNYVEEEKTKEITDVLRKYTRSKAHVKNVVGLEDLYEWTVKDLLYDQEIVGVVRIWSPTSEKKMRAQKDWKPKKDKKEKKKKLETKTEIRGSKRYMDADDF